MTNHDVSIRRATTADLESLSALIAASYATLDDGSYDRAALAAAMPLMSHANPKLVAEGTYYIAEIDSVAAGCGGWSFLAPGTGEKSPGVAHIRHFATDPGFKRRGVAGRLLRHCLDEARSHGAILMKSQATLPAEAFYAAFGFRRLAEVRTNIGGQPLAAIDMELSLE